MTQKLQLCRSTAFLILLLTLIAPPFTADNMPNMVNPEIDETGPFCYLSKPNSQLAVMGHPKGTQLTYDGALYTGATELCFFLGDSMQPLESRQRELVDGWLPIFTYADRKGDINYQFEIFADTLDGKDTSPLVNFIRVTLTNQSDFPSRAHLTSALRYSAGDHRVGFSSKPEFNPDWHYTMTEDRVIREGQWLLLYPEANWKEAVPGTLYSAPFKSRDHDVFERAEVCLAHYTPLLKSGEAKEYLFKMPRVPIPATEKDRIEAIRKADYETHRQGTIDFYTNLLAQGAQLSIPEKKVIDAHRASLVHDWMAIWTNTKGQKVQGVNKFQYNWFWLRDGAYIMHTYDLWGFHDLSETCLNYFLKFQKPNGLFQSQEGQLDGAGQALYALGQHYALSGDKDFARRIYPHIPPAMRWLEQTRSEDEFGIMPPATVHDNEFISGRYTGHNFWALLGTRYAVMLARATGHDRDANNFLDEYNDFHKAFMKRLDAVCGSDGPIPPGLDVEGGQDWGNLLGVYPSEVLDPFDPRVTATLEKVRREKYAEGCMTYKGRIHQYLTTHVTQNHLQRGEQQEAVADLYGYLLHTSAAHEGFEWQTSPWGERDTGSNFPPHGWGAAKYNELLRNMLILERGGNGGLESRQLHLFTAISPAWVIPGEEVAIRNAPTEVGRIDAVLSFTSRGAELRFSPNYRKIPESIVVHIPWFVELKSYRTDASESHREGNTLVFSPDMTLVSLKWKFNRAESISFDSVVDDYKKEYRKRYTQFIAQGNQPRDISAPKMLSAEERKEGFAAAWGPQQVGIAMGKPVTTNAPVESSHEPRLAVDGNARDLSSCWWAGPPAPQWLQIDLEDPVRIGRIQVVPYWDFARYYQYTVEVSKDGDKWTQVADMSTNTKPGTNLGYLHEFEPTKARFVRITVLHNSANPSAHLVEVKVFPVE